MKKSSPFTSLQMAEIQRSVGVLEDTAAPYSIPVFKRLGGGLVDLVGTGFLIEHHVDLYLVTAAHVMDHHETEKPLFYFLDDQRQQVIHGECRSSSLDVQDRKNDSVDITVVRLPAGEGRPSVTNGKRPITPDMVSRRTADIEDGRFIVAGYPLSRFSPDKRNRQLNPFLHTWIGKIVPDDAYGRLGFNRQQNLLVQFEQRHVMTADGSTGGAFPEPQGMSGAPVWHTVGHRNAEGMFVVEDVLLAGVLIERIKEGKCFLATNIDKVVDMILDFPRYR